MSTTYKKTIPLILVIVIMTVVFCDYYLANPTLKILSSEMQNWAIIIFALATGLGVISTFRLHFRSAIAKKEDWWLNVWVCFVIVAYLVVGLGLGTKHPIFDWVYVNVYSSLSATTYALLSLFITSAAFKAFRTKNFDASVLLFAGFLVLLGNMPASAAIWDGFPAIREWLLKVPVASLSRVIILGTALGATTLALRIITGRETTITGTGDEGA